MRDEVMLKFGVDQRAVAQGLRGVKGMVNDFKKDFSAKDLFGWAKGGLAAIGAGIGMAKMYKWVKSSADLAESITTLGETFGTSAKFVQQWGYANEKSNSTAENASKGLEKLVQKIGDARQGQEQAIKTFERYGIAITDAGGNARGTESIFEDIQKTIAGVNDPTLRAAMASEFFGDKLGTKLLPALRDFKELAADSESKILSTAELGILREAGDQIKNIESALKRMAMKGTASLLKAFTFNQGDFKAIMAAGAANQGGSTGPTEAQVRAAKELAEALEKVADARHELAFAGANEENRLLKALIEQGDAQRKFNALKDGTIEKVKAEEELLKKQKVTVDAKSALEKKAAEEKKKALKEEEEQVKRVNEQKQGLASSRRSLTEGAQDRSKWTVGELADRGVRWARNVQWLENQAKEARGWGRGELADQMTKRALDIRKSMGGILTSDEAQPLRSLQEGVMKSAEALQNINDKINGKGLPIDPGDE
ncbi:MAG TPA: hypothetical protein VN673_01230 [Clostridia bacterium]|nr:hypothetical protein [Clostridia bacterium]